MEKLHKYCLSVLLVIICSNISAQISNGTLEGEDCRALHEIYNQLLHQDGVASEELCLNQQVRQNSTIGQKQNAIDLIGRIFLSKHQNHPYKNKFSGDLRHGEKYFCVLKNFETNQKNAAIAQNVYLKTRGSKVRNKDYLEDLI